jgi:colicin import membrane protein
MKLPFALRLAIPAVAAMLSACSMTLLPTNVTPVVPKSTSVQDATLKLERVAAMRGAIEAEYANSEQICYTKFFVNNCLDDAKERRRSALAVQNAIEDEAQYYRRKADVDERDREVARALKQFADDEARAAATPPPPPREVKSTPVVAPKATLAARKADQDAKEARHAAQEQADAPKRAASVKAFEQRKRDAEKRQREVAERLAKKAAKAEADAGK